MPVTSPIEPSPQPFLTSIFRMRKKLREVIGLPEFTRISLPSTAHSSPLHFSCRFWFFKFLILVGITVGAFYIPDGSFPKSRWLQGQWRGGAARRVGGRVALCLGISLTPGGSWSSTFPSLDSILMLGFDTRVRDPLASALLGQTLRGRLYFSGCPPCRVWHEGLLNESVCLRRNA